MTYATAYSETEVAHNESVPQVPYSPRSRHQWMAFVVPVVLSGLSWMNGGAPFLTDASFLILTCLCIFFLILEFVKFPRRFGLGGILLYGGVLIWFCQDYMGHYFGKPDITVSQFSPEVVAKAAYFHCLFILCMVFGLRITRGQWVEKLILCVPEPSSEAAYIFFVLLLNAVGFSSFFFTKESFFAAVFHGAFEVWVGTAVEWTVGRTGNLNYNWGGYVAQLIQVGQVGGILAALVAIMVTRRVFVKVLCWSIWLYWCFFSYNGARRGEMGFMVLPAIAFLFIKYQAIVAAAFKRVSIRAYLFAGALGLALLTIIQIEGTFRAIGLIRADVSQVSLVQNVGNTMFTEGMAAYSLVPEMHPFFHNAIPGQGALEAIPRELWLMAIAPIPRALWTGKPVDEQWEWYNQVATGDVSGRVGTTISTGLVGTWYFNYGVAGVVEGGIFVGWLMVLGERCLRRSLDRPMGIFLSLGYAVWLFRAYRNFEYQDLVEFAVGVFVLWVFSRALRPVFGVVPADPPNVQVVPI
jgi:hypothetical protein